MGFIIPAVVIGILLGMLIGTICSIVAGARRKNLWAKLGYWLLTVMLTAVPVLFILLFSISTADQWLIGGIYALAELLFLLVILQLIRRRAIWITYLAIVCCFCAGMVMTYRYEDYTENLAVVSESDHLLWDYKPSNENNLLATLDEPSTLTITEDWPILDGATALYPVYAAFANEVYTDAAFEWPEDYDPWQDFEKEEPLSALECSTTTGAYKRLVDGEADIIFVAAPSDAQLQYAADKGEEMILTPIGRECFVFFVNAQNPVSGLTVEQLRGIYSGEITRWKELGADLGAIRAFQRDEGSGSQSALVRFMGDSPLMEPKTENRVDGMGGIIERTADYRNYPDAIGYSFRFYASEMVRNGEIKLLEINSVAPTKENILDDSYPICDSFYAVTLASNENPNVDLLIDWVLSEQGQRLIDLTGYVALN